MAANPRLSVVVPAFDEQDRLPGSLDVVLPYLESLGCEYELIVVDDGSTDGTLEVMRRAESERPGVRVVALKPNRGKGRALAEGVAASRGDLVLISDADFSTPIEELPKLQAAIDAGADVAIGSRGKRESRVEVSQPIYRVLMGKGFNLIVQAVLLPGLWDTQCGFKLFRGEVARELFIGLRNEGFGYDFDVLFRAKRARYRIAEVPVRWINSPSSRVSPISDSWEMLIHVIRLRLSSR